MNNRTIKHAILNQSFSIENEDFVELKFPIIINRPGKLFLEVNARGTFINPDFETPPEGSVHGIGHPTTEGSLNVFLIQLKDPLGNAFNKTTITEADLNKYRDARGSLKSSWTVIIDSNFKGAPFFIKGIGYVTVEVTETVNSLSASPLISEESTINSQKEYLFDLYRIGNLKVKVYKKSGPIQVIDTAAVITLEDPYQKSYRRNNDGSFTIRMADLKSSRKAGNVQNWKLRISGVSGKRKIFAQIYDTVVIPKELILDRIENLLGKNGENFELKVNWKGGEQQKTNRITLKSKTDLLSENLEIYDVLGMVQELQNIDIKTGTEYTLYENPFKIIGVRYNVRFKDFMLSKFTVDIVKSSIKKYEKLDLDVDLWPPDISVTNSIVAIPADLPTLRFEFETVGKIDIKLPGENPSPINLPKVILEIAFDVNNEGRISCLCWIDIETSEGFVFELLKDLILNYLGKLLNRSFSHIMEMIFDNLLGGVFTCTNTKWENNSIQLEYISDVLSERKPNPNYISGDPGVPTPIFERTDSWNSPQLTNDPNKIKHIVVLMMENRSFDHVLGYLSLDNAKGNGEAASNPFVKGLTPLVKEQFSDDKYRIQHLKNASFKESTTSKTGKIRTKIPVGVGHGYKDVEEQIDGGTMKGFVKNFLNYQPTELKEDAHGNTPHNMHPQDVLGYYTDEELKMYKYLTDNFAICDNYFSSHPGPTLPNRMYSLCGDLQKDRNGEPKIENSVDTSFFLSRELNIFDILDQYKVSWKVYESFPSVTMLRMFTRYAGDNKRIVNIDQLESDLAPKTGRTRGLVSPFPSVVFIDPSMHFATMNDDHPPADMLDGQKLVKDVYDALRSNDEVWKHTLFVVNYDEHGGLFDHVSPPIIETYQAPLPMRVRGDATASHTKPAVKVKYGVRVPCFVVSPYVEKGSVFSKKLDHTSILKTILVRFCNNEKPFLSDRVNRATSLGGILKSELRNKIPNSPDYRDLPMPDDKPTRSRLEMLKAINKNFTPMTKEKLSSNDADFHEMLAFLGRMVKPVNLKIY